jgi:predicted AlkP superfamily pyrophosphatase or phosphodiesterase
MKKCSLLFLLVAYCLSGFSQDTTQQVIPGRKNSIQQQKKPYVILISADGFRYDFAKRYHAQNLLRFGTEGVQATSMIPSYPSVTFPNHYAMGNKLKVADGTWYGGSPLWVLAEQQKMLSASFYWVASEAAIKGIKPTYHYIYNEKIDINNRIAAVVNWLKLPEEQRPHFITFYFPQVDHAAHHYGPESPEAGHEVRYVDSAINELNKAVKTTGLDVNFVFVSDHGMTKVDNENPIGIPAAIDTSKFVISGDGILVELYAKNKSDVAGTYNELKKEAKGYQVYLKSNILAKLHYSTADDWHNRIGDILLIPDYPKVFNLWNNKKLNPGWHGYDPSVIKDMHASFIAWGPAFKKHLQIPAFKNVDVFNLISRILGIKVTDKVDGTNQLADKILVKTTKMR